MFVAKIGAPDGAFAGEGAHGPRGGGLHLLTTPQATQKSRRRISACSFRTILLCVLRLLLFELLLD